MRKTKIPFYWQEKDYTCGPAVLRMVLSAYGTKLTEAYLARLAETNAKTGTSNFSLIRVLKYMDQPYLMGYRVRYRDLVRYCRQGIVIVDWMPQLVWPEHPEFQACKNYNPEEDAHYAIVISVGEKFVTLQDPVMGRRVRLSRAEFVRSWQDPTSTSRHWMLCVLPKEDEENY